MANVVVIPIYKEISELSTAELSSFKQILQVASKHEIFIVCSWNIKIDNYFEYAEIQKVKVNFVYFDKLYFENIEGYNRLMLNVDFYKTFNNFEFILIYQLDAWLFDDQLDFWSKKGYDYIGAPWLETDVRSWLILFPMHLRIVYKLLNLFRPMKIVGNGGFSLRRVSSFINFLSQHESLANRWSCHEDLFWSYATIIDRNFHIPNYQEALAFSFETEPMLAFKLNQNRLPMGCHAWEKYEPGFWSSYIEING